MLAMIWAQAHERAIGKDGTMPWNVPEDMALFKRATMGHPVIMGRNTWESLDPRWRPLPGRKNFVVTRNPDFVAEGAVTAGSLEAAYGAAQQAPGGELVWLIGGGQLYAYALEHDLADAALVTDLDFSVPGASAFAPTIPLNWEVTAAEPARGWLWSLKVQCHYRFTGYAKPSTMLPLAFSSLLAPEQ